MEQHFLSLSGTLFQKLTENSKLKVTKMTNTDRTPLMEFFVIIWKCKKITKNSILKMSEIDKYFHLLNARK